MQKIRQFLHNLFIPHENNNFRARSLHTDFLGLYLIFALVLSFSFKQIGLNNVLGFATDITVDKLFELTNQQRMSYHAFYSLLSKKFGETCNFLTSMSQYHQIFLLV